MSALARRVGCRVLSPTGLKIPPGCELVVGGEPQCWAEGHCLLVDDSFLHTVAHNGKGCDWRGRCEKVEGEWAEGGRIRSD